MAGALVLRFESKALHHQRNHSALLALLTMNVSTSFAGFDSFVTVLLRPHCCVVADELLCAFVAAFLAFVGFVLVSFRVRMILTHQNRLISHAMASECLFCHFASAMARHLLSTPFLASLAAFWDSRTGHGGLALSPLKWGGRPPFRKSSLNL